MKRFEGFKQGSDEELSELLAIPIDVAQDLLLDLNRIEREAYLEFCRQARAKKESDDSD
jgi:Zn-dependent peptidase ImmA (M78 family)